MLFIQGLCFYYDKTQRSGEEMRQLNSIRFAEAPEIPLTGEFYFHSAGKEAAGFAHDVREARTFAYQDKFYVAGGIFVQKQGEAYQVMYSNHSRGKFFKPVLTLEKNQYGRIIYNDRSRTFDEGIWYYIRTTLNFIHADESAFRKKMFFRKEPDFLFQDLNYLRYCGEYHKRRMIYAGKNHHH